MKGRLVIEGRDSACKELSRRALCEDILNGDEMIYQGRNVLTRHSDGETEYAIKYFSRNLKNRLVYAIWSSKARRSYEHGIELISRGIDTPEPISYGEMRGALNTLKKSVYISLYEESESLESYLQKGKKSWIEFANFAAELHKKGILHKDLNSTNVRIKSSGDKKTFSLIDLNRMELLPEGEIVKGDMAYKNLVRFSTYSEGFEIFAGEYCRAMGIGKAGYARLIEIKKKHEGM